MCAYTSVQMAFLGGPQVNLLVPQPKNVVAKSISKTLYGRFYLLTNFSNCNSFLFYIYLYIHTNVYTLYLTTKLIYFFGILKAFVVVLLK